MEPKETANRNRQRDELDVLKAVYGDENVQLQGFDVRIHVSDDFIVRLRLPADYPSSSPPSILPGSIGIPAASETSKLMQELFEKNEEVLLKWIEAARDATSDERQEKADVERKKQLEEEERKQAQHRRQLHALRGDVLEVELDSATFYTGQAITANKSKFVAHAARCRSQQEALQLIRSVQQSKYARATHNIWAYRLASGKADNDDDGETAAGGRLAELLHLIDAKDVLVVVSRYYGGINVGPQRFKYILQAARDAIDRLPAV